MSAFRVTFSTADRSSVSVVFGPAALAKHVDDEEKNWPTGRTLQITSVHPARAAEMGASK